MKRVGTVRAMVRYMVGGLRLTRRLTTCHECNTTLPGVALGSMAEC